MGFVSDVIGHDEGKARFGFGEQRESIVGKRKPMKEIGIGVIGAGYWGKKVIQEYLNLANGQSNGRKVDLVAVSDLSEANKTYCQEKFNIRHVLGDFQELLELEDVDAVHVCTPNPTHYQIGTKAIELGKHVLMEKPIAISNWQAASLIENAKEHNRVLAVGHIYRFNNAIRKCREFLKKGLGNIYHMRFQWTTYEPLMLGRDIIFDLGPHPIDIMNNILGKWPTSIYCHAKSCRQENEEIAYITCEFEDGVSCQIEMSWLLPGKVRELDIIGSSGSAKVDCVAQKIELYNGNDYVHKLPVKVNNTILAELKHFVDSIEARGKKPRELIANDGIIGARVVETLNAAKESLRLQKAVKIGYMN